VNSDVIKKAISELRQEDEALAEQERNTARRRAQISTAMNSLLALGTEEPLAYTGTLADAIRHAMTESSGPMTAPQVRDAIRFLGYDTTKHTNVLASIHNALKRFEQVGDVKAFPADGQTAFMWIGRSKKPILEINTTGSTSPDTLKKIGAVAQMATPTGISLGEIAKEHATRFDGVSAALDAASAMSATRTLGQSVTEAMKGYDATFGKSLVEQLRASGVSEALKGLEDNNRAIQEAVKGFDVQALTALGRIKFPKF